MTTSPNRGEPKFDAMTETELARYFEDHRDDDSLWQKQGRRIRGRRGPSTVFQMRLAPEELEELVRAAEGNVSEFVRSAALEKARRKLGQDGSDLVEQVRKQVRDLSDTVAQL